MPRWNRPPLVVGDPADPESLSVLLEAWIVDLTARNYSPSTVKTRRRDLLLFFAWCSERSLLRASDVTRATLLTYQHALFQHRTAADKPLSFISQRQRLHSVKLFFQWLARKNVLVYNPASEIEMPRVEKRLPRHVLTAQEADRILSQPDVNDALGIRDRAVLEVLYSTGMRRAEMCGLELFDVDTERGTVLIRQGKGKKDRIVPMGARACRWLEKYIVDVRPVLANSQSGAAVFLTHIGEPFKPEMMSKLVTAWIEKADIGKKGSCHLFRHAMATLMLENGADIRFIQQMLGHASLETTEIYTHVSIRKLKEIHTATHPSAKWESSVKSEAEIVESEPPRTREGEIDRRYNRRRNELNRLATIDDELLP